MEEPAETTRWLDSRELGAWVRLEAVVELLPARLDALLRRECGITHFEYFVLAMLSEAPGRSLSMSELAGLTQATLPRLSHVVRRMEDRALVHRFPEPGDKRITRAALTDQGLETVLQAAPLHAEQVRSLILDPLTHREQVDQLAEIMGSILGALDPQRAMADTYTRYDPEPAETGAQPDAPAQD